STVYFVGSAGAAAASDDTVGGGASARPTSSARRGSRGSFSAAARPSSPIFFQLFCRMSIIFASPSAASLPAAPASLDRNSSNWRSRNTASSGASSISITRAVAA
ncbi:hypothetical protein Vretifemale_11660, partial [Volvox reticuliferus]